MVYARFAHKLMAWCEGIARDTTVPTFDVEISRRNQFFNLEFIVFHVRQHRITDFNIFFHGHHSRRFPYTRETFTREIIRHFTAHPIDRYDNIGFEGDHHKYYMEDHGGIRMIHHPSDSDRSVHSLSTVLHPMKGSVVNKKRTRPELENTASSLGAHKTIGKKIIKKRR